MDYIYQHPDFGLGNFINLTPTIKWLHQTTGKRIPAYFSNLNVRRCFSLWNAIEHIYYKPDTDPIFGSNLVNPDNDKPDYQFVFEKITGQAWTPDWHTYVHIPTPNPLEQMAICLEPYVVVICGSGSENSEYFAMKNPGEKAYKNLVYQQAKGIKIYAVGSYDDADRSPWLAKMADKCFWGDIRVALKIIAGSQAVFSNDCGLAHAAGAMNKPLQILWKDTPRERCKNPGTNTKYIYL